MSCHHWIVVNGVALAMLGVCFTGANQLGLSQVSLTSQSSPTCKCKNVSKKGIEYVWDWCIHYSGHTRTDNELKLPKIIGTMPVVLIIPT